MRIRLQERLAIEERLLQRHFGPGVRVQEPGRPDLRGVVGRLTSNGGTVYTFWMPLAAFPHQAPALYVVDPALVTPDGRALPECSHRMHTRDRNEHGHPQICHYHDAFWREDITLFKVVMKLRLWIEAYEAYRRTGKPISNYLGEMEESEP